MIKLKSLFHKNIVFYIIPIIAAIFNFLIILFPKEMVEASKEGLILWFNNALPSLLPFIIGTNILISLGLVSFAGTILSYPMEKLFNVSGNGAFAWILGMTSGYPIGAKITSDLLLSGDITPVEAQRLTAFTNNSGPLFILGFVGVSLIGSTKAGVYILVCHYISSFILGLLFSMYKKNSVRKTQIKQKKLLKTAFTNMRNHQIKDGRSIGAILSDSIKSSMETILSIGGFIILFSVINKAIYIIGIKSPMLTGFLEITNGCKSVFSGEITVNKLILITGIISWGGLSIHAQAAGFLSKANIKISLYILSKILHCIISMIIALLFSPIGKMTIETNNVGAFGYALNSSSPKISVSFCLFIFSIAIILIFCIISAINSGLKKRGY